MAREWVSLFTALDFGHPGQRDIAVWNWGGFEGCAGLGWELFDGRWGQEI